MEIVILFEKIRMSTVVGKIPELCNEIKSCAKVFQSKEDIQVRILEGTLANIPEREQIAILVSSNQSMPNQGRALMEFKQSTIDLFNRYGIELDKSSLAVKINFPYDVNSFVRRVEKVNTNSTHQSNQTDNDEFDYEQKSKQYLPVEPLYTFERVILPKEVLEKIEEAIGILECENKVFKEWGLYEIQPHPSTSLSFYGPSGTGKTMAAEAIASKLGKKILKVSYADVESKYHGEGPKMVKAIFLAAANSDAVLFFDEADSLLSKRLTSVSQGSEQAINSMRSQLLICLEEFRGIVIFATNLVVNYDQAFLTRLISVEFKNPDVDAREAIWNIHIRPLDDGLKHQLNIPLSEDVNTRDLAERYDFAGREIRNAVVSACVSVALAGRNEVCQKDFIKACDKTVAEKEALEKAKNNINSSDIIKKAIVEKLKKNEEGLTNVSSSTEQ